MKLDLGLALSIGTAIVGTIIFLYRAYARRRFEQTCELIIDRTQNKGNLWSGSPATYYVIVIDLAIYPAIAANWDTGIWDDVNAITWPDGYAMYPGGSLAFSNLKPGTWAVLARKDIPGPAREWVTGYRVSIEGGYKYVLEFEEHIPTFDTRKVTIRIKDRERMPGPAASAEGSDLKRLPWSAAFSPAANPPPIKAPLSEGTLLKPIARKRA